MGRGAEGKKIRVLLLSAPIGTGHRMAAKALAQNLAAREDTEVIEGDIFSFFPAFLGRLFLRCYLLMLKYAPGLYELCYRWGDGRGSSLRLRQLINRVLLFLGRTYLDKTAPTAVLATHATPAGIVGLYKKQHPSLFLGAVVTDFCLHRWWINEGVDVYFVATEGLLARLPKEAEGAATGIPVRQRPAGFDREHLRERLGWREKVCLFLGGGEGLLPMEEILQALAKEKSFEWHLVFITGHDLKKAERLQKLAAREGLASRVEVYGFRDDAPDLEAAADLAVSKAGGLTCAELLAAEVPFVLYAPLPGQEQSNAAFLQKQGAAFVAKDLPQLLALLHEPPPRSAVPLARPRAAADICEHLLRRLQC